MTLTKIPNGIADRIVVFRRGENAGERLRKDTTGDEIVRLMVGK